MTAGRGTGAGPAARKLQLLAAEVIRCEGCPRLRHHAERVARHKRRSFRDETYWGRPVPGFGDPAARLLVLGLAPAAHGANRTGRLFTGDSSGDWLFRALHRAGFASSPLSRGRDDGLSLHDVWVSAACRCAPPDNRPSPGELERCAAFLDRELAILGGGLRVIVCLGGIAWGSMLAALVRQGQALPRPRPRFSHGAPWSPGPGRPTLVASYHPSRQNTNTRRLTEVAFDQVFARARTLLAGAG